MRVLQLGEAALRTVSAPVPVDEVRSADIQALLDDMVAVMEGIKEISPANGNGLAAPQVSVARRVAIVFFDDEFQALINPQIVERSAEMRMAREGCLSCFYLRAEISRHVRISVRYMNRWGNDQAKEFSGDLAALVQHEIDHLDGILFMDRLESAGQLVSIDALYRENPERVATIRRIVEYVAGQTWAAREALAALASTAEIGDLVSSLEETWDAAP